ncbi:4-hydroxy-3-methylbut-2-enyl diphosphate reductase [bacterium]|nr:4-hydroxy-3-methylbut-2-enyl diphosphate reductase [bacterium]
MEIVIEQKSKPCPGVERAISLVEEAIGRGDKLFSVGKLIHNRREVDRLRSMGMEVIDRSTLDKRSEADKMAEMGFLIRAHGEIPDAISKARKLGMVVVDATCPIVQHSQEVVEQNVREGWAVIIAGKHEHPEVEGLLARAKGNGIVVSSVKEAESVKTSDRSILLAQSTIDGELFDKIRVELNKRVKILKIFDTTCRFIGNRREEVRKFVKDFDTVLVVGGSDSSNLGLLFTTANSIVKDCYRIEGINDIDPEWFKKTQRLGIVGGASTPRWQMEEIKAYIEEQQKENNPKGLNNRKGGTFKWWIRKNRK